MNWYGQRNAEFLSAIPFGGPSCRRNQDSTPEALTDPGSRSKPVLQVKIPFTCIPDSDSTVSALSVAARKTYLYFCFCTPISAKIALFWISDMNYYSAFLTSGILISLVLIHPAVIKSQSGKLTFQSVDLIDRAIICTLAGLLGARLLFVFLHWPYYAAFPGEILQIWLGGMDWAGAVVTVVFSAAVLTGFKLAPLLHTLDRFSRPALVVAFSHGLGCMLSSCMPGASCSFLNFLPPETDWLGASASRWPSAGLLALGTAGAAYIFQNLSFRVSGMRAALTLSALACITLLITFTLGSPSLHISGIRLDTLEAAAVLAVSLAAASILKFRSREMKSTRTC